MAVLIVLNKMSDEAEARVKEVLERAAGSPSFPIANGYLTHLEFNPDPTRHPDFIKLVLGHTAVESVGAKRD